MVRNSRDKRIDVFLKTQPTKKFIELLEFPPTGVNLTPIPKEEIIQTNHRYGTFFHRELAIEFAMWLDPIFKRWIINKIDEVLFGNYKKHWEAHAMQEEAKFKMETLKQQMLLNPSIENTRAYFEAEKTVKTAKSIKLSSIRNQYKMFDSE